MIKKAILELIQKRCNPSPNQERYGLQYIQGYCDQVWQEFVAAMNTSKKVDSSFYAKEYNTTVSGTASNYYTTLPEEIINLPRIGSGVVSIRTTGLRDYYSPVSESDFTYILTQEVYRQDEDIYFYVTYDTVYYGGSMTATEAAAGVTMRLVIPFHAYLMTEELPIPTSQQAMFIDMVVERILGTPQTDMANKNINK